MGFVRQTWTLTVKNIRIALFRHWFFTTLRAFIAPVLFMFFISYAKNFFVPPSDFGIGSPVPVLSFIDALRASVGGRNTVAFVNNGYTGGDIETLIDYLTVSVNTAGLTPVTLSSDDDLLTVCRSSLRGVSGCYGAASFHSSPTEGPGSLWNYTLRADGALGAKIFVNQHDNDQEIYVLPFQHAIDAAISVLNGSNNFPDTVNEYPFTSQNTQQRMDNIRQLYMNSIISILGVVFFVGIVGITYQLTGHMASERELGMSQLIEAMTPNRSRTITQAARLLANHLAFDIIYAPSWIVMAVILWVLVFTKTDVGLLIGFHLLAGLSLSSMSVLGGSLFSRAQLSGISVTIASLVLAIVVQVVPPNSTGTVAVLGLLFPPMTYTLLIIYMARFEHAGIPTNLLKSAPDNNWQLPGIAFFVFFVIQALVFPVISAFIEQSLYGTSSRARKMVFNPNDNTNAVELKAFSKHFIPSWWQRKMPRWLGGQRGQTVFAVNDLTLTAIKGQIFVLLGANGSGKSTTLDAISGLNKITSGEIIVDGTGGLGLCPQKNVLWDELSVYEHVAIFNGLKAAGKTDSRAQIVELIKACDLEHKLYAKSRTLSGGQKRKLQLAMMFTGGSRVCCIDEVSSGLDPLSRRKIWDILLRERGIRTLLFTTHFLDEADVLSDHIAILSKGNLKAEGSAVELKSTLGGGYHVVINSLPEKSSHHLGTYKLQDSAQASAFINQLEEDGINDYEVTGPRIEDVFIRLAEEVKTDLHETVVTPTNRESILSGTSDGVTEVQSPVHTKGSDEFPSYENLSESKAAKDDTLDLVKGEGTSVMRQSWILFCKRVTVLRRNYFPYIAAVIIPIITAGLVTFFLKNFHALSCSPADQASTPNVDGTSWGSSLDIPIGPSSAVSPQQLASLAGSNLSVFHTVNTYADFSNFIDQNYANVTPGGIYIGDSSTTPTFAYIGNYVLAWSVLTQNLIDNVLGSIPIATQYQVFAVPFAPSAGKTLQLIFYFGLSMAAYPGFFALYPTLERIRKVRALHYSNGIQAAPLWLAYLAFDFIFVMVVSVIVIALWVGISSAWYYPGYLFVVFFLYGLTSTLFSYVVSLFVSSQLAAFAFAAGTQAVLFLLYFIAYLSIITYSPAYAIDHHIIIAHFTIALITPSGNLLRALLLTLNEFSVLCNDEAIQSYPGAITAFGGPILYLIVQAGLLLIFLVWWDSGYKPSFLLRTKPRKADNEDIPATAEPDLAAEITRVESSTSGLRVKHLTKSFGEVLAVEDITFGISPSTVFALLGPNGAGKSTTISLVRGDLRPDNRGGDVFVEGISVNANRTAARRHLGVCPQFDAMDSMTVDEHLRFYARARGVPDVQRNVDAIVAAVGLAPYRGRMAQKLSGGSKRKLSLGIALMGNPAVLLLDEPSSGMDAASKRVMWRTLEAVTRGRGMLITTHSMEEADRLAHRAGIMATRMLALDTVGGLRKRFGDVWYVHIVLKGAPHVDDAEGARVRGWIEENVKGAVFEDARMWYGQLRFKVMNKEKGNSVAALFRQLEEHREDLRLQYYSVSQTTLDQVFLTIVGQHNVEEEMSGPEKKKRRSVWRWVKIVLGNA